MMPAGLEALPTGSGMRFSWPTVLSRPWVCFAMDRSVDLLEEPGDRIPEMTAILTCIDDDHGNRWGGIEPLPQQTFQDRQVLQLGDFKGPAPLAVPLGEKLQRGREAKNQVRWRQPRPQDLVESLAQRELGVAQIPSGMEEPSENLEVEVQAAVLNSRR